MTITTIRKVEKKKLPIIFRIIHLVNFVLGTMPMFRKKGKKIMTIYKKEGKLYIVLLLTNTMICICLNKQVKLYYSDFENGFDLKFILKITALMSTILSTCLCWITSLAFSKCHLKIICNNSKINELLMGDDKKIEFRCWTKLYFWLYCLPSRMLSLYYLFRLDIWKIVISLIFGFI